MYSVYNYHFSVFNSVKEITVDFFTHKLNTYGDSPTLTTINSD